MSTKDSDARDTNDDGLEDDDDAQAEQEEEDSFNQQQHDGDNDDDIDSFDDEVKDEDDPTTSVSALSPSLAFGHTAERKESEYDCLDEAALQTHMNRLIADVAAVIHESKDKAALLLRTQNWNKEKLIAAYFEDPARMLKKVGMEHYDDADDDNGPKAATDAEAEVSCPICDDDVPLKETYSLGDGHRFCRSCFSEYLSAAMANGRSCILTPCPAYSCPTLTHTSTFRLLASPAEYARYCQYVLRSYVEDNVMMRWCTHPSCPYAVHALHRSVLSVRCPLRHGFCFQCGEEDHEPASCHQLQQWKEKNQLESDNAHWIIANTKRCPSCSVRIEKNQGCNHITCRSCKHEWCWVCNGGWQDHGNHTGGFYRCNKYNPREAGRASKWKQEGAAADAAEAAAERKDGGGSSSSPVGKDARERAAEAAKVDKDAELNRYLFYYQRYHNHAESAKFAAQLRKETEKRIELIAAAAATTTSPASSAAVTPSSSFSSSSSSSSLLIDYASLQQATDTILRCRHVLQYTYVFAYFLHEDERQQERNLFEFLQQQLEKSVEALSELSEQRLDVLSRRDERSRLVNYTRVTDKFRENLLAGVRNGLAA